MASKRSAASRQNASTAKPRTKTPAVPYTPTEAESQAARFVIEKRKKPPTPRFDVTSKDDSNHLSYRHPDKRVGQILMAYTLGTGDSAFCQGVVNQLANVACRGNKVEAERLNFVVSMVRGIEPKDPTEALLATQMAAIHNATMAAARQLSHAGTIDHQDSASNMLNKLARTFAAQVEALKKYRASGEQTIKVQHVTVNDGGQAIVGTVNHGGRGSAQNEGQSHEPSGSTQQSPALLGQIEADGVPLSSAGSNGQERVPLSRGASGSTEGES
jgi:hypothetical protein